MSVLESTPRALTAEQLEHFQREGYLIVRGLYSLDETGAMRDHFMALHAQSPLGDYYRAVLARAPAASSQSRYFLYPGVGHCAGGPGADQVGVLDAIAAWDETGQAPEVLTGTKADGSITRPHCAWPNVARYRGTGEANDPASWQCVPRAS